MTVDNFHHKASSYDQRTEMVSNVDMIAEEIATELTLDPTMKIMDFGSGTGLLLERIAPLVDTITAVDVSPSMNAQLEKKRELLPCNLEIIQADITRSILPKTFDGIMSSMTIHHIKDIPDLFSRFYCLLKPGGFLAIADLDIEDGTFHEDNFDVFHFGFDREELARIASDIGFQNVNIISASTVYRSNRDYPVFLLTATK